jgi:hypothetical protein
MTSRPASAGRAAALRQLRVPGAMKSTPVGGVACQFMYWDLALCRPRRRCLGLRHSQRR